MQAMEIHKVASAMKRPGQMLRTGLMRQYLATERYSKLPSSVTKRRGRRIENFFVLRLSIGIEESLG